MEYLIGFLLSFAVAALAAIIGLDRDRGFYPTVLCVIASYYVLFAVMGGGGQTLVIEIAVASVFSLFAILAYKRTLWLAIAAIVGHGVFDFVHHFFIQNPGGIALVAGLLFGVRCDPWSVVGRAPDEARSWQRVGYAMSATRVFLVTSSGLR